MGITKTAAPVEPAANHWLNSSHRCETCNAQAWVAATVNGTQLTYCSHHASKYETKLRAVASTWHDERPRLYGANDAPLS